MHTYHTKMFYQEMSVMEYTVNGRAVQSLYFSSKFPDPHF